MRSVSPLSEEPIELRVTPTAVEWVTPSEAVLTLPIVGAGGAEVGSAEDIWMTFCRQIHFFASRDEAEIWAADRGDIVVVTVEQGFELGLAQWAEAIRLAEAIDGPSERAAQTL